MFIFRRDNKRRETGIVQVSKMENCDWCNLSEEEKRFQVYERTFWSVYLSDEQDYIGRCILVLKRHCGSMTELTEDEWEDLRHLICKVETCLKTILGAALCNWSCLMNSFYKESEPNPHLHIHVRPRYDKPVMVNGSTYIDSEFGHHYAVHKSGSISVKDKEELCTRLKEWLCGAMRFEDETLLVAVWTPPLRNWENACAGMAAVRGVGAGGRRDAAPAGICAMPIFILHFRVEIFSQLYYTLNHIHKEALPWKRKKALASSGSSSPRSS